MQFASQPFQHLIVSLVSTSLRRPGHCPIEDARHQRYRGRWVLLLPLSRRSAGASMSWLTFTLTVWWHRRPLGSVVVIDAC